MEYNPVFGIILPPEWPCRWYRITAYTDKNCADMHTIHWRTDSADTPAIMTRPNDRADVPAIHRPTDRWALCLTTIATQRLHRTAITIDPYCPARSWLTFAALSAAD